MITYSLQDLIRALSLELNLAHHNSQESFSGYYVAKMKVEMAVTVEKIDRNKGIYALRANVSRFNRWRSHQLTISWSNTKTDNVKIYLDGQLLQEYNHNEYVPEI